MKTEETQFKLIPEPTLRRLPKYIHLLKKLQEKGIKQISSSIIADELGLDSIQVRKDLTVANIVGKPKVGFDLDELLSALIHTLNWDNSEDAFLVGTGSLGSAIIGYEKFNSYGMKIIAAFDDDPKKIGTTLSGIKILPIEKLQEMIKRMHINIGVITVPAEYAQEIADKMITAGVIAIWNFAPVHIKVPEGIIVENVQLSHSLGVLTHKLAESIKNKATNY